MGSSLVLQSFASCNSCGTVRGPAAADFCGTSASTSLSAIRPAQSMRIDVRWATLPRRPTFGAAGHGISDPMYTCTSHAPQGSSLSGDAWGLGSLTTSPISPSGAACFQCQFLVFWAFRVLAIRTGWRRNGLLSGRPLASCHLPLFFLLTLSLQCPCSTSLAFAYLPPDTPFLSLVGCANGAPGIGGGGRDVSRSEGNQAATASRSCGLVLISPKQPLRVRVEGARPFGTLKNRDTHGQHGDCEACHRPTSIRLPRSSCFERMQISVWCNFCPK